MLKMILAILEAIPILDKWFKELHAQYTLRKFQNENETFKEALSIAIKEGDVTHLRNVLGKHLK